MKKLIAILAALALSAPLFAAVELTQLKWDTPITDHLNKIFQADSAQMTVGQQPIEEQIPLLVACDATNTSVMGVADMEKNFFMYLSKADEIQNDNGGPNVKNGHLIAWISSKTFADPQAALDSTQFKTILGWLNKNAKADKEKEGVFYKGDDIFLLTVNKEGDKGLLTIECMPQKFFKLLP